LLITAAEVGQSDGDDADDEIEVKLQQERINYLQTMKKKRSEH